MRTTCFFERNCYRLFPPSELCRSRSAIPKITRNVLGSSSNGFLARYYLCLMMRKNQVNLSALNTADMLKYIKVIFQGPVVFLFRGRGGGGGGRKILVMSRKCAVIFLFPSPPPPLFPVNWQSFFYHPSFYFVGSEIFPLHSLRKPWDTQNPPSRSKIHFSNRRS